MLLRVLNQLSRSAVFLCLFTQDSWWYFTQPPTPMLAPTLTKKCFWGEHMERQAGGWGVGAEARRRLFLRFSGKVKRMEAYVLCVFLFTEFFL